MRDQKTASLSHKAFQNQPTEFAIPICIPHFVIPQLSPKFSKIYIVRKPLIIVAGILVVGTLSYCGSSKKTAASAPPAKPVIAYTTDIAAVIDAKCSPCHIPAKNGNKKPLDTYASVKANIDDILVRVQLDSTHKNFMPRKKPKLDDATIALLKEWKAGGMLESKP